jgi:homospermidine synthase
MLEKKFAAFPGRFLIIGFGSIGQGILPLLLRHLEIRPEQLTIITAEPRGREVAALYGIPFIEAVLTRDNYSSILEGRLGPARGASARYLLEKLALLQNASSEEVGMRSSSGYPKQRLGPRFPVLAADRALAQGRRKGRK